MLSDVDPIDLVLYHCEGGEWMVLKPSLVHTMDGDGVVEKKMTGFSLFTVGMATRIHVNRDAHNFTIHVHCVTDSGHPDDGNVESTGL